VLKPLSNRPVRVCQASSHPSSPALIRQNEKLGGGKKGENTLAQKTVLSRLISKNWGTESRWEINKNFVIFPGHFPIQMPPHYD
jgi:hypothetical protein